MNGTVRNNGMLVWPSFELYRTINEHFQHWPHDENKWTIQSACFQLSQCYFTYNDGQITWVKVGNGNAADNAEADVPQSWHKLYSVTVCLTHLNPWPDFSNLEVLPNGYVPLAGTKQVCHYPWIIMVGSSPAVGRWG